MDTGNNNPTSFGSPRPSPRVRHRLENERQVGPPARSDLATRWALPFAVFAFFAATARGYGVFRDELYYIVCGRHLAWGYVEHPPMVAAVAAAVRALFGESWVALRIVSAAAFAATVLLVGDTARVLGGGRFGRCLAQALAATAPVYLSIFSIYSMNALDILVWAGLARIMAAVLGGGDPRLWLAFGGLAGAGLLTKIDVGLLGTGLAVGIVVSRRFDLLRNRWIWIGGAVAGVLFAPHVFWQVSHGFPTREFVANAQQGKIARLSPLGFVGAQLMLVGPVAFLLGFAGMAWLLVARRAGRFRALGWAALVVLAVFALSISKPYYYSPAWTILFPAAGVAVEAWSVGRFERVVRVAASVLVLAILVAAPLAKPLISEDHYVRYAAALGITPGSDENQRLGRLQQFFADMHGWEDMAKTVAKVAAALPPEDRAKACFYGQNYGEAGAIDYFGPGLGLPPAMSGHNSYWLWGPGKCTGEIVLIFGGNRDDHLRNFASVDPGGEFHCIDCMPYENDRTIWIARGLKVPLADAWAGSKHYE